MDLIKKKAKKEHVCTKCKKIIIAIGALGVVALGAVLVLQNYQIRIDKKSSTPAEIGRASCRERV